MNRQSLVLIGSGVVFVAMLLLMNASTSTKPSRNSGEKEMEDAVAGVLNDLGDDH